MNNNFFKEMQPNIMERLGEIYNRDCEYKQALKNEAGLFEQLEKDFSESQIQMIKAYQAAIYATCGITEMIAYVQGMRDMATILGITENKGK